MLGGEIQRKSLNHTSGYSEEAQRIGKPAYLEPNSDSMQKPIEGLPALGLSATKKMQNSRGAYSNVEPI